MRFGAAHLLAHRVLKVEVLDLALEDIEELEYAGLLAEGGVMGGLLPSLLEVVDERVEGVERGRWLALVRRGMGLAIVGKFWLKAALRLAEVHGRFLWLVGVG